MWTVAKLSARSFRFQNFNFLAGLKPLPGISLQLELDEFRCAPQVEVRSREPALHGVWRQSAWLQGFFALLPQLNMTTRRNFLSALD